MKINLLFPLLILTFCQTALAQLKVPLDYGNIALVYRGPDFVIFKGSTDTIFCPVVEVKMAGDDIRKVIYTVDGDDKVVQGKECLQIQALKSEGVIMESMPVNPAKPHKRWKHMFRSAEGYITLWSSSHKMSNALKPVGDRIYDKPVQYLIASIDGGPLFIPSMKNYRNMIYPLFQECDDMHKGGFSDYFSGVIRLCNSYNATCGLAKMFPKEETEEEKLFDKPFGK